MKTSILQQLTMVEFMEEHGDLSKPSGGPRGRQHINSKWKELCHVLNNDPSGDSRSEEKWRKVWSDMKNNTKKKTSKICRAAGGTGGGPALSLHLTDLESRIMQILGIQAAVGMPVIEAGFEQDEQELPTAQAELLVEPIDTPNPLLAEHKIDDWNTPGTSSQHTAPPEDPEEAWKPPAAKKKKTDHLTKLFVESDAKAREYARERDAANERLEIERLRVHEYEICERVRQRDEELRLQAQWLEFMKEAMNVIVRYFERDH